MLVLLVPTMIWVRLRVPGRVALVEFLCLLPLTIPALVIVVGISNVYAWVTYLLGDSRADADLRVRRPGAALRLPGHRRGAVRRSTSSTLAEAARSLGAGWFTVIVADHRSPTSGRACSRPRSSPWRWCSASSPSPRCSTSTRCQVVIDLLGKSDAPTVGGRVARLHRLRLRAAAAASSLVGRADARPPRRSVVTRRRRRQPGERRRGGSVDLARPAPPLRRRPRARRPRPADGPGRAGRPARPLGLRQDHGAADPRRAGRRRPPGAVAGRRRGHHRGCRRTSATWAWSSRPTASSRT